MACYKSGGCGPYEGRACSECPASKPEYVYRGNSQVNKEHRQLAPLSSCGNDDVLWREKTPQSPIKVKVFIGEDGVSCVMKNTDLPVEIEIIDEIAVKHSVLAYGEPEDNADKCVDAYINQLCGDGFVYVEDENIIVTNDM